MTAKANNAIYLSKEKLEDLKKELEHLRTAKRREIAEALEFARSLGDLSENAEYIQAREDQAKNEERILELEDLFRQDIVMTKKHHSMSVEVGSTVTVEKEGGKGTKTYQIVGSAEADTAMSKISNRSPLGEALYGKKKGDLVSFKTPAGVTKYKIIDIE